MCRWRIGSGAAAGSPPRGVLDFAGGLVVHLTAGVSALVLAVLLGPRLGFPDDVKPPHAPWMTMVGACMLWVGWFGFNAGSALKAGGDAGMAMTVTHISAATATLVWIVIEWSEIRQAEHGRRRHRRDRRTCLHHARVRLCRARALRSSSALPAAPSATSWSAW